MNYTKINEEQIKQWLKENLSEERYLHTLGTAQCAKKLAQQLGLDGEKAYYAGLLHDCAKCFTNEKLLEIIKGNLEVDECELLNYKTLHAPVSAYIAEKEFGVSDKEILSAIRWHTLGRIDMTDFEKLILAYDDAMRRDSPYRVRVREDEEIDNGSYRYPRLVFERRPGRKSGREEEK